MPCSIIKDTILHNKDAKMNLGHPFLIYGICKQAGVPLEDNEAWIHQDQKRFMTWAMNPRKRMSFESISPPKTNPERHDVVQQRRDVGMLCFCNVTTLVLNVTTLLQSPFLLQLRKTITLSYELRFGFS